LASGVTIASKKIVREAPSMNGVPVMPMWAGPTEPPGGFLVAYGPMVVGPTSQMVAPVVALYVVTWLSSVATTNASVPPGPFTT
jgi:hypothetical protein